MTGATLTRRFAMGMSVIVAISALLGVAGCDLSMKSDGRTGLEGLYGPGYTGGGGGDGGGTTPPSLSVTAPALVRAAPGYPASFRVVTSNATTIVVDYSALPAGNDARFTADYYGIAGTFTWMPTSNDSGPYVVHFEARNTSGSISASTTIWVTDHRTDVAPVVTAPADTVIALGSTLKVSVYANDPDGDPIFDWKLETSPKSVASKCAFEPFADGSAATLVFPASETGWFSFTFRAANFLTGSATTRVFVKAPDPAVADRSASTTGSN